MGGFTDLCQDKATYFGIGYTYPLSGGVHSSHAIAYLLPYLSKKPGLKIYEGVYRVYSCVEKNHYLD